MLMTTFHWMEKNEIVIFRWKGMNVFSFTNREASHCTMEKITITNEEYR